MVFIMLLMFTLVETWKWTPASGGVDHYNVYVSIDGSEYVFQDTTRENSFSLDCVAGSVYRIKCEAVDAAGNVGEMSEPSDSFRVVVISIGLPRPRHYDEKGVK